ncbi:hypothetical protein A4A49_58290, partial [Nicotiana attenuata]
MSECFSCSKGSNRRCRYGLTANYFMAWTLLNAGRRFFKCPKHELPPRVSNLIHSLKKEKEALICERNAMQRKI